MGERAREKGDKGYTNVCSLFQDSATALVNVRNDTFHNSLEDEYYRTLQRMDDCQHGTSLQLTNPAASFSLSPAYLLSVALAWVLGR